MNSRFNVIENPEKGKPFRLQEVATKRLSKEAFHTRKSAKHASNKKVDLV